MNLVPFYETAAKAIDSEDSMLIEACGYEEVMAMYESAATDAGKKLLRSEDMRNAKQYMKDAKRLIKSNPKEALKKYDEAIKAMERLSDKAQDIPDNSALDRALPVLAKTLIGLTVSMFFISGLSTALIPLVKNSVGLVVSTTTLTVGGVAGGLATSLWADSDVYKADAAVREGKTKRTQDDTDKSGVLRGITRGSIIYKLERTISVCKRMRRKLESEIEKSGKESPKKKSPKKDDEDEDK